MKFKNILIVIGFSIILACSILTLTSNILIYKKISNLESFNMQVSEKLEMNSTVTKENIENQKTQYEKTLEIKQTYDNILEEQKKQTLDSVEKDNALIAMKESADKYFENKEWAKAYREYQQLIVLQPNNTEIRYRKALSLYNSNPMDSSKYKEIISDCDVLRKNNYPLKELEKIETLIKKEKGL